jgi:hypothetical protein
MAVLVGQAEDDRHEGLIGLGKLATISTPQSCSMAVDLFRARAIT